MNERYKYSKLLSLGTLLLRNSDQESLEKNLFEILPEAIDIDRAALFVLQDNNVWKLHAATDTGDPLKILKNRLKKYAEELEAEGGQKEDMASPLIIKRRIKRKNKDFRVAAAFPLPIMGKIQSFLVVARNKVKPFTTDDIIRLDNMAAILSTTMENRSAVARASLHADTLEQETRLLETAMDKRTQELFREREFSGILSKGAPYLLVVLNNQGGILFTNNLCQAKTERTALELEKMRFMDLFKTEKDPENPQWFKEILRTGKPQRFKTSHLSKGGEATLIIWNTIGRIENDTTPNEIICIGMDVTKIADMEAHNQITLETIPDGLYRINDRFEVLEINNYAARLMGLSPNDIIGKKCYNTICGIKKEDCPIFSGGQNNVTFEENLPTRKGAKTHVLKSIRRYEVRGREYAVETFKEITRLKQMEKQIRNYAENLEKEVDQRTAELKEAQHSLIQFEKLAATGRFASCMAHEINSPIYGIKGCLQAVLDEARLPDDLAEFVEMAIKETDRISDLISRMQNIHKESRGQRKTEDIHKIIHEVLGFYSRMLDEKRIIPQLSLMKSPPKAVVAADQIKQVFYNLINNAMDAMPLGGDLKISTNLKNNLVEITITDTGVGISKKIQERIFDAFFTTKAVVKGVGLGLPMCWGIVRSHGGRILVNSRPGKGSAFTVVLPLETKNKTAAQSS